jgi:hypothetical protein
MLSFLKRDRFRQFVPKSYCVPTRTFLGVPDRSSFLTVPERFMSVSERFRPFYDVLLHLWTFFYCLPEDPVFSTSRQKARLEKKLLPHKAFIGSISFGKSFFSSRALCPGVLKTGSSGIFIIRIPVERLKKATND